MSYLATVAAAYSSPQRCGHIIIPTQYRISSIANAGGLLHDVSANVQLSADTGDLYCQCSYEAVPPTTTHQELSVFLNRKQGDEFYLVNFTILSPCQQAACTSWNSTHTAMVVPSSAKLGLMLRGKNIAECSTFNQMFKLKPIIGGWLTTVDVVELMRNDCIKVVNQSNQIRQLQITSHHTLLTNTGTVDAPMITITQTLPFDVRSCLSRALINSPNRLSLLPRNGRRTIPPETHQLTAHHPKNPNTSDHNVDIHDLVVAHHHQRWLRQANSMPRFESLHHISTVMENSDIGTTVDTITAIDTDEGTNGVLTYSMTPSVEFSRGLFAIDSSSGVVMTTGEQ